MGSDAPGADTHAVLVLCGRFGTPLPKEAAPPLPKEAAPLTPSEYHRLDEWLRSADLHPAELLSPDGEEVLRGGFPPLPVPRLLALLGRRAEVAAALETWGSAGLWVVSTRDAEYPERLRVGRSAPPLLYGVGERALLGRGGLAVVGSRDADDAALSYARRVGHACAEQGISIVSGGARGVDSAAMLASVVAGGCAVGVLADSLLKAARSGKYREALGDGSVALVTPYDPGGGFERGKAMGRNRHVYALADHALVVSTAYEWGGTWSGASDALEGGRTPVFVRIGPDVPAGNRRLLEQGAAAFPDEPWSDLWAELDRRATAHGDGGEDSGARGVRGQGVLPRLHE